MRLGGGRGGLQVGALGGEYMSGLSGYVGQTEEFRHTVINLDIYRYTFIEIQTYTGRQAASA